MWTFLKGFHLFFFGTICLKWGEWRRRRWARRKELQAVPLDHFHRLLVSDFFLPGVESPPGSAHFCPSKCIKISFEFLPAFPTICRLFRTRLTETFRWSKQAVQWCVKHVWSTAPAHAATGTKQNFPSVCSPSGKSVSDAFSCPTTTTTKRGEVYWTLGLKDGSAYLTCQWTHLLMNGQ